jgi:hypothetical protein
MRKKPIHSFTALKLAISLALFLRMIESAGAQRSLDKERPFDGVPGILISCQSVTDVKWTSDACTYLIDEVKRRAAASKLGVSVQPSSPDMAKKKFGQTDGFDGDKAIRMAWTFEEYEKGRVKVELVSHRIWEATKEEAVPGLGSRRSELFYMQDIIFVRDSSSLTAAARDAMSKVLDTFFGFGEGKVKGTKF